MASALNRHQFKTWVSNSEFDKLHSGEVPFDADRMRDYLAQHSIQNQVNKNAHKWGYSHTNYGAGDIAPHMREKLKNPEALAKREKERADAVASTTKLIAPYGGTEAHAIQLHVAANRAAAERARYGEIMSEHAIGYYGTGSPESPMPNGLENMYSKTNGKGIGA